MAGMRYPGYPPDKNDKSPGLSLMLSLALNTATHPLTTVKVLVQVGHEPLPAVASKTIFGNPVMKLPGLLEYGKHIKKTDGFFGLYRGLVPRLVCGVIGSFVNDATLEALQSKDDPLSESFGLEPVEKEFKDEVKDFTIETCKQTAAKCIAVMVSHPFQVITVRMIVQYVGKETIYSGMFSSIREVFNNHGIFGFFDGVVPRLVGEVLSLWIYRTLHFFITQYGLDKEMAARKEINIYTTALSQWLSSLVTYPFTLVSNVMITNHVGLVAGEPPAMPVYTDWVDCFKQLRSSGDLWRGSSLLRRTAKMNKRK
ncbi:mitochondrial carrier homolog 2-like [Actinia tenebrosa]|uniref:Mitochondrial carrier homolog 2-like n=1 Tax=Actinia tenebrosa TaxID=6105 RepID=A0A6P8HDF0_ACTTE|nr:mitochondrial carrier homolog 2-like [Actinia tenebrosa]